MTSPCRAILVEISQVLRSMKSLAETQSSPFLPRVQSLGCCMLWCGEVLIQELRAGLVSEGLCAVSKWVQVEEWKHG